MFNRNNEKDRNREREAARPQPKKVQPTQMAAFKKCAQAQEFLKAQAWRHLGWTERVYDPDLFASPGVGWLVMCPAPVAKHFV